MTRSGSQSFDVRPIDPLNADHINLVADRMRATLVEVLGPDGEALYGRDWLQDRVRWHLRPAVCTGQVFLAHGNETNIIGHVIVRLEGQSTDGFLGLISTIYVQPMFRRAGVACALLCAGEGWLLERHATTLATDTSETNLPLIRLFESCGYTISFRSQQNRMVRLSRSAFLHYSG